MNHVYGTTCTIGIPGADEVEVSLEIQYDRHAASSATSVDPGCSASVSIYGVFVVQGEHRCAAPWLEALVENDEGLLAEIMQHWVDEDEAARDRRDEERAELAREDRR